jgi:hypothetical protein
VGPLPAPPPIRTSPGDKADVEATVVVPEKYVIPPDVPEVKPVPPLLTGNVLLTPITRDNPRAADKLPVNVLALTDANVTLLVVFKV